MGYVYLCEHSEYKVGGWAHINGWIGRILSRDAGYVYSEVKPDPLDDDTERYS